MLRTPLAAAALLIAVQPGSAQVPDHPDYGHGYTIAELLEPCVNADNDARWGIGAEIECEQYLVGYTDAFLRLAEAAGEEICLPEKNRPDEVRWAFMKWATMHYDRRGEPAGEGVWAMLHDAFPCE